MAEDKVTVEMEIAAPPERVFEALVNLKQLAEWWGKEPSVELTEFRMDARKGGRWGFKAKPAKGHDHGPLDDNLKKIGATHFETHGEIVELVRPKLLVWSWIANYHQHPEHATTVRWELEPTKKGTRVRVTGSPRSQSRAKTMEADGLASCSCSRTIYDGAAGFIALAKARETASSRGMAEASTQTTDPSCQNTAVAAPRW